MNLFPVIGEKGIARPSRLDTGETCSLERANYQMEKKKDLGLGHCSGNWLLGEITSAPCALEKDLFINW